MTCGCIRVKLPHNMWVTCNYIRVRLFQIPCNQGFVAWTYLDYGMKLFALRIATCNMFIVFQAHMAIILVSYYFII